MAASHDARRSANWRTSRQYKSQFLRLFGFGIDGVDYAGDVDPRVVA